MRNLRNPTPDIKHHTRIPQHLALPFPRRPPRLAFVSAFPVPLPMAVPVAVMRRDRAPNGGVGCVGLDVPCARANRGDERE